MNPTLKLCSHFLLNPAKQQRNSTFSFFQPKLFINSPPSLSLGCLNFHLLRSSSSPYSISSIRRCSSEKMLDFMEPDCHIIENASTSTQESEENENGIMSVLKRSNSISAHVVLASTVLALIYPPSFTWFTSRYYAPSLGFFMFSIGINTSEKDFLEAINKPRAILVGYIGQFMIRPLIGYLFGILAMKAFHLPTSIGAGIMLTSCVSSAQLSNFTVFLTDPTMAPLSIVTTSLTTTTAVFVTPALSLLLIGKSLPVDVKGIMSSIMQIVIVPIAAGLVLNRFFPLVCAAIRPWMPPLSLVLIALCNGSPMAMNKVAIMSPFGLVVLLLVVGFHLSSFVVGYFLAGTVFTNAPDVKALQRTISFETGMTTSLLALALANNFFRDPLTSLPPAISVAVMSLMGFYIAMLWSKKNH